MLSFSLSLPHLVPLVNGMLLGFDMCRSIAVTIPTRNAQSVPSSSSQGMRHTQRLKW